MDFRKDALRSEPAMTTVVYRIATWMIGLLQTSAYGHVCGQASSLDNNSSCRAKSPYHIRVGKACTITLITNERGMATPMRQGGTVGRLPGAQIVHIPTTAVALPDLWISQPHGCLGHSSSREWEVVVTDSVHAQIGVLQVSPS